MKSQMKKQGRPKKYNPKKNHTFRLSVEERSIVNNVLKRLRAPKIDLPKFEDMDFVCNKPEVVVLPDKVYSDFPETCNKDGLPEFALCNVVGETKMSYIVKVPDYLEPIKISKKTLNTSINNHSINCFPSYIAVYKQHLSKTAENFAPVIYGLERENFYYFCELLLKHDRMLVLEYFDRLFELEILKTYLYEY